MASKVGTTVTCANCSETEVWTNAIANLAVDGDTVILPDNHTSPDHWSGQHILNKAITLQGAGINATIVLNDFSGGYWIRTDLVFGKLTTWTGITFKNGTSTGSGNIDSNSVLRFIGSSTSTYQLRVHHCKFEDLHQWPVFIQQVRGVFDHNVFLRCDGGGAYIYGLLWQSDPVHAPAPGLGDGSWAYPTNAGGDDAIYFEDNFFDQTANVPDKTFFDGTRGGRGVVRYNTFNQDGGTAAVITCHGLENRNRSIRHFEFYNNYVQNTGGTKFINQRGGTMVVFNNRATGAANSMGFQCDREGDPTAWGRASGSNPVDVNDTSFGGTNSNPTPFYTGVMAAGTGTDLIVVSPSPGWANNLWVGYCISDLDLTWTPTAITQEIPQYVGSVIVSSTSNTITTQGSTFGNPHNYAAGHDFVIRRVVHCMDQIGRAGTSDASLITGGGTSGNPPVLPAGWNNQETEPVYEWNNLNGVTDLDFGADAHPFIRPGIHFINDTIMPGYPWTDDVSTRCGAEDYTNVTLTGLEANGGKGGFTYPHPLTGATSPSVIVLSGDLTFGNVIIGDAPTSILHVTNAGEVGQDDIIVTSVTYPTAFTGATGGFTVAPGDTHDITVTFTPVAEITYTGNIVVDSNAALGTETIACSGTGVLPAGGGGKGKGHKKGLLSRRG